MRLVVVLLLKLFVDGIMRVAPAASVLDCLRIDLKGFMLQNDGDGDFDDACRSSRELVGMVVFSLRKINARGGT